MDFVDRPETGGGFEISDMEDARKFQHAFSFSQTRLNELMKERREELGGKLDAGGRLTAKSQGDVLFKLLPEFLEAEKAPDWTANIHFQISDAGDYTMRIDGGRAATEEGLVGKPTFVVKTDIVTFGWMLAQLRDSGEEGELNDEDLETVAGGMGKQPYPGRFCPVNIGPDAGGPGCPAVVCCFLVPLPHPSGD